MTNTLFLIASHFNLTVEPGIGSQLRWLYRDQLELRLEIQHGELHVLFAYNWFTAELGSRTYNLSDPDLYAKLGHDLEEALLEPHVGLKSHLGCRCTLF
jgi:hypothetical protein